MHGNFGQRSSGHGNFARGNYAYGNFGVRRVPESGADARAAFGPWGMFGPPGPGFRRRGGAGRARRGDVRAAILALLQERPMHGYEIITELASRTEDAWRPSPGSVYPTLQLLEDEGLVSSVEAEGKRRFSLTEEGRTLAAARAGRAPWEDFAEGADPEAGRLREAGFQLAAAVGQVARAGSSAHRAQVAAILREATRRIYALLAEEPAES